MRVISDQYYFLLTLLLFQYHHGQNRRTDASSITSPVSFMSSSLKLFLPSQSWWCFLMAQLHCISICMAMHVFWIPFISTFSEKLCYPKVHFSFSFPYSHPLYIGSFLLVGKYVYVVFVLDMLCYTMICII